MRIFLGGKVYFSPQEVKRQIVPLNHFVGIRVITCPQGQWAAASWDFGSGGSGSEAGQTPSRLGTRFRAQSHWWYKERVKYLQVVAVVSYQVVPRACFWL